MRLRSGADWRQALRVGSALLPLFVSAVVATGSAVAHEELPARKAHRAQPARMGAAAPDRTGSLGSDRQTRPVIASAAVSLPVTKSQDEGPLVPILLPAAPRSRMVACGESWHAMKMQGTTGDDSWRDFALKCLVAKAAPAP